MNEASKTRATWSEYEYSFLRGEGIDIGCGTDPILPTAMPFDRQQGDANEITKFVSREFDYVFSSHCLEHMLDPQRAIGQWWSLVRDGGILFLIVPDEDLYEQGFWPSRFNSDHKWTFTIAKQKSWSPVSINLFDLVRALPQAEIIDIKLQDHGYQRHLLSNGYPVGSMAYRVKNFIFRHVANILAELRIIGRETRKRWKHPVDQTKSPSTLAQIQCIVRKRPAARGSA